jgi:hypothetical protein
MESNNACISLLREAFALPPCLTCFGKRPVFKVLIFIWHLHQILEALRSINASSSETRHAVVAAPSFIGFGKSSRSRDQRQRVGAAMPSIRQASLGRTNRFG